MRITPLLFVLVSGLLPALSCRPVAGPDFKRTAPEALALAAAGGYLLPASGVDSLLKKMGKDLTVIDLRPPYAFEKGHPDGALNIPVAQLLDREQWRILRKSHTVLLVGETAAQANGPWLLLNQLGLENVIVLDAPYPAPTAGAPGSESARYDYASIFKQATQRHATEVEAGKPKQVAQRPARKQIVPAKKPAPKTGNPAEEGC